MDAIIRNEIYERKEYLIGIAMKKHWRLIRAVRLDPSDVRQELTVRLLESIGKYDPTRCSNMDAYLTLQLRYRLLHMRECAKLSGVPQAPRRDFAVMSINAPNSFGLEMQIPSYDRTSNIVWLENEIASLPDPQRTAIDRLLSGKRVHGNNKHLKAARSYLRGRVNEMASQYA
jgi:DNA-directed RNA polymerase specialized sigma24 family protein